MRYWAREQHGPVIHPDWQPIRCKRMKAIAAAFKNVVVNRSPAAWSRALCPRAQSVSGRVTASAAFATG